MEFEEVEKQIKEFFGENKAVWESITVDDCRDGGEFPEDWSLEIKLEDEWLAGAWLEATRQGWSFHRGEYKAECLDSPEEALRAYADHMTGIHRHLLGRIGKEQQETERILSALRGSSGDLKGEDASTPEDFHREATWREMWADIRATGSKKRKPCLDGSGDP